MKSSENNVYSIEDFKSTLFSYIIEDYFFSWSQLHVQGFYFSCERLL